jgi:hypothetical protein
MSLFKQSMQACFAVLMMFGLAGTSSSCPAQTITVNPPTYSNLSLPYPDLYLNAASHWQTMSPQGSVFLPSVPLTRVVGNVHWTNIQPGSDQASWSAQLNGMGMGLSTSCNASTWWQVAQCYPSNGNISTQPNNLLYTFYRVPFWASVTSGGTKTDPSDANSIIGWTIHDASRTCAGSTCTVTMHIDGSTNMVNTSTIIINGNSYNATVVLNATPSYSSTTGLTQIQFSQSSSSTAPNGSGYVTYTNDEPPSDVYSSATCNLPDGSTSPNGDCYFKSYITYMMMHTCGNFNVTTHPSNPRSDCVIHYWEGWNEFNSDGFWTGDYTRLAKMMVDADAIIHEWCDNCYFIAGSVSAGGDAGHNLVTNPVDGDVAPDNSTVYIEALGQLLKDWYSQAHQRTDVYKDIKPDIIAIHPYPGYDNIYMPAMPETNVPANFDPKTAPYTSILQCTSQTGGVGSPSGCVNICGKTYTTDGSGNTTQTASYNPVSGLACTAYVANPINSTYGTAWPGCSTAKTSLTRYQNISSWTEPSSTSPNNPKLSCRDSFLNSIASARQLLTDIDASGEIPASWFNPNMPIWNTESGWGNDGEVSFPNQNTQSAFHDPTTASLSTFIQQAYIARMSILAAEAGFALNLWYQWDEATTNSDGSQSFSNWGQLANSFSGSTAIPTRAAYTFNRVYYWLQNKSFVNTPGCSASTSYPGIWTCSISGPNGYHGTLLWYTPFDQSTTYPAPSGQNCLKDIDGNVKTITAGSAHTILNRPALYDNTASTTCTGTDGLPE